jgi:LacI family transcriptional regulator
VDPASAAIKQRVEGVRSSLIRHGGVAADLAICKGSPGASQPNRPDDRAMVWHTPEKTLDRIIDELVVKHRVDAIIAHNDFIASALLKQCRKRAVDVPGDVAVVGYLNHYLCEYVDPPLTSVDLQHHQAAKAMVEAAQDLLEASHGSVPHQLRAIAIEPKVIRRVSA